jgi:hypothetical protein
MSSIQFELPNRRTANSLSKRFVAELTKIIPAATKHGYWTMNSIYHVARFIEAKYSVPEPLQDAMEICRGELCAANYTVVQIGHSKLIGCMPGNAQQFVEVTLEKSDNADTHVVFHCHATPEAAIPATPSTHIDA